MGAFYDIWTSVTVYRYCIHSGTDAYSHQKHVRRRLPPGCTEVDYEMATSLPLPLHITEYGPPEPYAALESSCTRPRFAWSLSYSLAILARIGLSTATVAYAARTGCSGHLVGPEQFLACHYCIRQETRPLALAHQRPGTAQFTQLDCTTAHRRNRTQDKVSS